MFKKVFTRKPVDWGKHLGIKTTAKQKQIDKEIRNQVAESGIYSIFDEPNSKKEVIKRINERANENWKRAGIIIGGIGVLVAIAEIYLGFS